MKAAVNLRSPVLLVLSGLTVLSGCGTPTAPAEPAASRSAPASAEVRFRDVAEECGITFVCGITDETPLNITRMVSGGAGFLDYDQDGWPDLVLAGVKGVRLYQNQEGKTFRDVSSGSGLDRISGEPQGVASGDFDGDMLPDLLITRYDGVALMRNLGRGRFANVTERASLDLRGWTTSASFADVNGDGRLDLYIGRYVRFEPGMPEYQQDGDAMLALGPDAYPPLQGALYLNLGNGKFREATRDAGMADAHGKTLGVAFADYDQDGDQDLYLANDQALGDFYLNDGKGRFRNVAVENGTAASVSGRRQAGMGVDWGDYDGDARFDLIVATFYNEPKSLYHQDAGAVFSERGQTAGLLRSVLRGTAFGVAFEDWNNDGAVDLMVANGHVQDQLDRVDPDTGYRQATQVFLNDQRSFREVSAAAGPAFAQKIVGRALAAADFDRDGRRDAVVANFAGRPLLLRNESAAGHWITFRLQGKGANRQGVGAVITVESGGRRQVCSVQTGRSYLSAFPPEAHFGLGAETEATAEIRWPDGSVQRVANLKLDAVNEIEQQ